MLCTLQAGPARNPEQVVSYDNRFANLNMSADERAAAERQLRFAEFLVGGVVGVIDGLGSLVARAIDASGLRRRQRPGTPRA